MVGLGTVSANGAPKTSVPTCGLPESDAEALVILSNLTPRGYWWDHTNLTVAIQAHPSITPSLLESIRDAIGTWSNVLLDCFDGRITLEAVSRRQSADIILHYVPHAGGMVFSGFAICHPSGCSLVVSDLPPPGSEFEPATPQELGWVTLHELGHALGLGHATNLEETTDLMGYGWLGVTAPVLSDCDVDAIAFVFAWALEGAEPRPPGPGPFDCSLS
jgi:hypothetical protein